jgi:hypothetical protein
MPVAAQVLCDFVDGSTMFADLECDPSTCPVRQRQACRSDPRFLLSPRPGQTCCVRTGPPVFAPHQAGRTTKGREIHQLNQGTILDHRRCFASLATGSQSTGFDMDPDRLVWVDIVDAADTDVAESNKELTDADRVHLNRGSPF